MSKHPRQQHDFIGHDMAEQQIVQAMAGGRLPHAWLISGSEGVGKATLAYRFARAILANKKNARDLSVSPDASASKLIAASSHPDLLILERPFDEKKGRYSQNIPVDDVRKIAPFLRLTASQGSARVVIVDGAGTLGRAGQNAILKILEEPPENAIILLTAESSAVLLPTIRSRCRVLKLERLSEDNLRHIAAQHELTENLDFNLKIADGSAARLLRYSDCDAGALYEHWCNFIKQPHAINARLALAESWSGRNNEDVYYTAQEMIFAWLQRLIHAKARGTLPEPLLPTEIAMLQSVYAPLHLERLLQLWENLNQDAQDAEQHNLDKKIVLLGMFEKTVHVLAV
jgi:DNA polymerase III subunit delta'